jgi:hypothetical protein
MAKPIPLAVYDRESGEVHADFMNDGNLITRASRSARRRSGSNPSHYSTGSTPLSSARDGARARSSLLSKSTEST